MDPLLMKKSFEIQIGKNKKQKPPYTFKPLGFFTLKEIMNRRMQQLIKNTFKNKNNRQINQIVFQFKVTRAAYSWTQKLFQFNIIKTLQDFLVLQKYFLNKKYKNIPHIPIKKQNDADDYQIILNFFQQFLSSIAENPAVLQDQYFMHFIGLPSNQQMRQLNIYCQIMLKKRSGGRYTEAGCRKCLSIFGNWKNRYFTVTSEGIFYSQSWQNSKCQIKEMIAFSIHFKIDIDQNQNLKIIIYSCHRVLEIKAPNLYSFVIFINSIRHSLQQNDYLQLKRYGSFADIRKNCNSKVYVDGQTYFYDLYTRIKEAKKQVFITDWILSPHFLLIRPNNLHSQFRLDNLLKKTAEKGVKICIIIYQQFKFALPNDSQYVKQYLQKLHHNIKVLRHPNFILIPFLWSHHQKIVIVDQKYGFLGGLDIAYGRFDNQNHNIVDLGKQDNSQFLYFWQGLDYCNFRKKDLQDLKNYTQSLLDRHKTPRMPWHDIAVQITGDSVIDLTRHFVQYWNFVNFQTKFDQRQLLMQVGINQRDTVVQKRLVNSRLTMKISNIKKNQKQQESTISQSTRRPISYFHLKLNRSNSNIPQQIIKRRNTTNFKELNLKKLLDVNENQQALLRQKMYYLQNIQIQPKKLLPLDFNLRKLYPFREFHQEQLQIFIRGKHQSIGKQNHQLIRSASTWSIGIQQGKQEKSIYYSYIQLISQAEQFIYIENQFFMSNENKVVQAIKLKILNAYKQKKKFKVMILIPLLPGFEGEVDDQNSSVLKVQMHLQYQTICRGGNSLLENLSHIQNLDQYIKFYSLRNHGIIDQVPFTQIIYIHSKLMIIDDKIILMGSANINDRSLLGTRDSQIGIIIEDQQKKIIKRGQFPIYVNKCAHQLRKKLYIQHFGLSQKQSQDFMDQNIWWMIAQRANKNTQIYRTLFACYPDDNVKSVSQLKQFQKGASSKNYELLSTLIKGNAVQFPMQFMKNEDLSLKANQKQYYVPYISFT